jgi:isocitrate dehydrogenase
MIAEKTGNKKARLYAETLDEAVSKYLENAKNPSRKVNEIDNRGSTFALALYWAQSLAKQTKDLSIQTRFTEVAKQLEKNKEKITEEILAAQGDAVDLGGYYFPDPEKASKAMRPSPTFNAIIDGI